MHIDFPHQDLPASAWILTIDCFSNTTLSLYSIWKRRRESKTFYRCAHCWEYNQWILSEFGHIIWIFLGEHELKLKTPCSTLMLMGKWWELKIGNLYHIYILWKHLRMWLILYHSSLTYFQHLLIRTLILPTLCFLEGKSSAGPRTTAYQFSSTSSNSKLDQFYHHTELWNNGKWAKQNHLFRGGAKVFSQSQPSVDIVIPVSNSDILLATYECRLLWCSCKWMKGRGGWGVMGVRLPLLVRVRSQASGGAVLCNQALCKNWRACPPEQQECSPT